MRVKLSDLVKMHQYMVQLDRAQPQDIELELDDGTIVKGTDQECEEWSFTGLGGKYFALDILQHKDAK